MLKTAKVVGLNSDTAAALALISPWLVPDQTLPGQRLFLGVVFCECEDAFSKVRQALSLAEEKAVSSTQPAAQRLPEILGDIKEFLKGADALAVLLAAVVEDGEGTALYLLIEGKGLIAELFREGKENNLASLGEGEVVSGILKEGDRIVLSTESLLNFFTGKMNSLGEIPIESFEDEIASYLPEAHTDPLATIALEKEQPEEIKEIPKEIPKNNFPKFTFSRKLLAVPLVALVFGGLVYGGLTFKNRQEVKTAAVVENQPAAATPTPSQIYPVSSFSSWLDLDLIKAGFSAQNLSLSHGNILVLDNNKQTLVSINTKSKAHDILAGAEKIGEAKISSLNGDVAWVYSEDKGVLRIEDGKIVNVAKVDEDWGDITEAYGFAGNIYLLDAGKNQIWKYLPIASGFSDKKEYLKEGTKTDFIGVKRLQIESSVYILKKGGEILRFTQGSPDFFAYSGLDKPIKDAQSFFVSSETDNLYLLDGGNNRLLVLDKKGVFLAEYQSDQFNKFSDLVVDEEEKIVYLLEGSKIYSMELK